MYFLQVFCIVLVFLFNTLCAIKRLNFALCNLGCDKMQNYLGLGNVRNQIIVYDQCARDVEMGSILPKS